MVIDRTIAATTHGRFLVVPPVRPGPWPLLVGFHGYAEGADAHLERLVSIPGIERWLVVAVQGLHRFYRGRSEDVVASWMTRQDRELAIADNRAYVAAVIDEVVREHSVSPTLVFAGFSQGVAMAFRAAASSTRPIAGVIALGGDVPPELDRADLEKVGAVLLGRGDRDDWYTRRIFDNDIRRLAEAGCRVTPIEFEGGHEWTPAFSEAASQFLAERR
jgi:predicted esterase